MEIQALETEVKSLVVQARQYTIINAEEYQGASRLWNVAKDLRAEVASAFDSIIEKAHKAHKEAVAKKKEYDGPLEEAQKLFKTKMIAYDQEQERKRRIEQARLENEERKKAEEEALALAAELEKAGLKQEAEQVIAEPVKVPPVVAPKTTPKVEGFSYRSNWKARVVDLHRLVLAVAAGKAPTECLLANEVFLNQQARALKSALSIPGVEAVEEKV